MSLSITPNNGSANVTQTKNCCSFQEEYKMKSYKTEIPQNSLTQAYLPVDYTDAFASEVVFTKKLSADEIMINFWTIMPRWVNGLFKLRNLLVRPFGLDAGDYESRREGLEAMIHTGSRSNGLMSVAAKSDNETVVLLTDKHLNAYLSVYIAECNRLQTITAITLVHYHSRFGRIYFFFIRSFHKIVVKSMLKSTLKRIAK